MAEKASHTLLGSAAQARRTNKPLMEKRRRQRINECLSELKSLVLQALQRDTSRYSKLEKADILEMTVKHLRTVQRQQMTAAVANDPSVLSKYRAGFNECAGEVSRYLRSIDGLEEDVRLRLLNHLATCTQRVNQQNENVPPPPKACSPPMGTPTQQPISVQIPNVNTVITPHSLPFQNFNNIQQQQQQQQQKTLSSPQSTSNFAGTIQIIPSTLPNGQVAYILHSPNFSTPATNNNNDTISKAPITPTVANGHLTNAISVSSSSLPVLVPSQNYQTTCQNNAGIYSVNVACPAAHNRSPAPASEPPVAVSQTLSPYVMKDQKPFSLGVTEKERNMWRPW
ncbi:transcription factor HES-1 [Lingula anatina]|uniref:Transcription factor HES-1 n=1 Tax=Lingula anatina TaxID=7574 RepID=A0A1S3IE42_LINAN|nr:transcription factor HES-1 [Lingula anatina]|eukprot:XP_013395724.1 transcription factor HES-1 [Lingula anatina]